MQQLLLYMFKLSLSLAIVWLFYQLLLRKLTFYNWNRWYLLLYTFGSFLIPFVDISQVINRSSFSNSQVIQWIPVIRESGNLSIVQHAGNPLGYWAWALILLGAGSLFMTIRLLVQYFSFLKMRNRSTRLPGYSLNVYRVSGEVMPFSFGNAIFINPDLHNEDELREIIFHEYIHVRQKHSIDILWSEFICIMNWFNPFAWLLRRSVRQNLEFIADQQVIGQGIDRKNYQYLLLKVIGNNQFSIASQFSFSSLKKRIAMMNKMKTARLHVLRFLFVLPLLAVLLLSFRKYQINRQQRKVQPSTITTDTLPKPELYQTSKGYFIILKSLDKDASILILNKDKQEVRTIRLSDWNADPKKYDALYGELPPPPPPPVPRDPVIPPPPPPPPAKNDISLSKICTEWEITKTTALMKLKDGRIEKYVLTDPEQRAAFEKKYGHIMADQPRTTTGTGVVAVITPVAGDPVIAPVTIQDVVGITTVAAPVAPTGKAIRPVTAVMASPGTTIVAPVAAIAGMPDNDPYGHTITGKEDIVITITSKTTRDQLESFKTQMKEKDIELSFDNIEYNAKGLLTNISGTMRSKDGHSNFVANDFTRLILAMVRRDGKTYFKVSVSDGTEVI